MVLALVIHYLSIAILVALACFGTALGQYRATESASAGIARQPEAQKDIFKVFILGMAILETASLLGFAIGILLLQSIPLQPYAALATVGITCAVSLPAFFVGLYGSLPIQAALAALARQPFFGNKIIQLMMLTQTLIQTPLIFGFLIGIFIHSSLHDSLTLYQALALFAAGLAIGLGTLGTIQGISRFAHKALEASSLNKKQYSLLWSFSIISISLIETSAIFAFIIALSIYRHALIATLTYAQALIMLGAALLIGIGTLAPSLNSGKTAATAVEEIPFITLFTARDLFRVSMFGQVFIDSITVYALVTALLMVSRA